MGVVSIERKVLVSEILQIFHRGIQEHARERFGLAGKLELCLFKVVQVKVEITKSMDELLWTQTADLRDHEGEQGIGCNIERNAQKEVGAALIELTT